MKGSRQASLRFYQFKQLSRVAESNQFSYVLFVSYILVVRSQVYGRIDYYGGSRTTEHGGGWRATDGADTRGGIPVHSTHG